MLMKNVPWTFEPPDATAQVPGPPVTVADEFVLIGGDGAGVEPITVAALAQACNTNSWEVVTGMARRLPRVYHAAAGPVGLRTLAERRDEMAQVGIPNRTSPPGDS